jgi:hypothetical protein
MKLRNVRSNNRLGPDSRSNDVARRSAPLGRSNQPGYVRLGSDSVVPVNTQYDRFPFASGRQQITS